MLSQADQAGLLSKEHFSVVGTLIDALASLKSYRPKDKDGPLGGGGRNPDVDFHGEKRRRDTHESKTEKYTLDTELVALEGLGLAVQAQQDLTTGLSEALTVAAQTGRMDRRLVLEIGLATEILVIGAINQRATRTSFDNPQVCFTYSSPAIKRVGFGGRPTTASSQYSPCHWFSASQSIHSAKRTNGCWSEIRLSSRCVTDRLDRSLRAFGLHQICEVLQDIDFRCLRFSMVISERNLPPINGSGILQGRLITPTRSRTLTPWFSVMQALMQASTQTAVKHADTLRADNVWATP